MRLFDVLVDYFDTVFPIKIFLANLYSVLDQIIAELNSTCLSTESLNISDFNISLDDDYSNDCRSRGPHAYIKVHPNLFISLCTILLTISLLYATIKILKLLFKPMNRVKYLQDVGYIADSESTLPRTIYHRNKTRDLGLIPPVYPNGWYAILESRSLLIGDIKNVNCLGYNLVVYRGEEDNAYVMDAYCSHLGGNFGVGGKVIRNSISCPYHGWLYSGVNGKCVKLPFAQPGNRVPATAQVKTYRSLEMNGFIYIWHHFDNQQPTWEPEVIREIFLKRWTYRGRTEHYINVHIQELHEQGTDLFHLSEVYGPSMFAGTDLRYLSKWWLKFMRHRWTGEWSRDPFRPHVGLLKVSHKLMLFNGQYFPYLDFDGVAEQIGPGIVYMKFSSPSGRGILVQSILPMKNIKQRLVQHIYFQHSTPTFIAKLFLYHQSIKTERDIMIWNNKKYISQPVFSKTQADTSSNNLRRWYLQFYDDNKRMNLELAWQEMMPLPMPMEKSEDEDNKNETTRDDKLREVRSGDLKSRAGVVVCSLSSNVAGSEENPKKRNLSTESSDARRVAFLLDKRIKRSKKRKKSKKFISEDDIASEDDIDDDDDSYAEVSNGGGDVSDANTDDLSDYERSDEVSNNGDNQSVNSSSIGYNVDDNGENDDNDGDENDGDGSDISEN